MDSPIDLGLTEEEVSGITGFLGYGNPQRSVWFIGLEEGWGKCSESEARENLKPRGSFQPIMDLYVAHQKLKEDRAMMDIRTKTSFTPVWVYEAKMKLAMEGRKDWSNNKANRKAILEDAKNYIRFKLGRTGGDTFLTELSPIPRKRASDPYWMDAFRRIPTVDQQIENRRNKLKSLLKESIPSRVICFGERPNEFESLLDIEWFAPISSSKKIRSSSDRKCLLLPFFGRQMSHAVIESLVQNDLL